MDHQQKEHLMAKIAAASMVYELDLWEKRSDAATGMLMRLLQQEAKKEVSKPKVVIPSAREAKAPPPKSPPPPSSKNNAPKEKVVVVKSDGKPKKILGLSSTKQPKVKSPKIKTSAYFEPGEKSQLLKNLGIVAAGTALGAGAGYGARRLLTGLTKRELARTGGSRTADLLSLATGGAGGGVLGALYAKAKKERQKKQDAAVRRAIHVAKQKKRKQAR